jgi:glycosyltransferase involved in cell wall biosynthesis
MNILFITPAYALFHVGGVGESCARIATGLAALDHCVSVAVFESDDVTKRPHFDAPSEPTCYSDGEVNVEYFPFGDSLTGAKPPFGQQAAFRLQQVFLRLALLADRQSRRPNVMISFFPLPLGMPTSLVAATRRIPLVAAFRGNDIGFFAHDPGSLPILQQVLRVASASVFVAADLRDLAVAIAPDLCMPRIVYNGIDPSAGERPRMPATEAAPVFGAVGIFKPKKGIEVFLRAAERLGLGDRTLLVGDFTKSSSRKSEFGIKITGIVPQDQVLPYLEKIDVFVVPSTTEGCPNAALNAMAAGKVIVSSRVGALRDLLHGGSSAWFLDDWSESEMCRALRTLDGDPSLRRRLGEGARAVAQTLTRERELAEWDELLGVVAARVPQ